MEIHYSELKDIKPSELVKKIGLRIKSDNVILEIRGSGGKMVSIPL